MESYEFRAWENGKMYYQVRVGGIFDGIPTAPTVWNEERGEWLNLTGGEYTKVMQYTGFKDKNGKKIYTGDITDYEDSEQVHCTSYEHDEFINRGVVVWDKEIGGFDVTNRVDVDIEDVWLDIEIIGNIYENPELMEI